MSTAEPSSETTVYTPPPALTASFTSTSVSVNASDSCDCCTHIPDTHETSTTSTHADDSLEDKCSDAVALCYGGCSLLPHL